MPRVFPQPWSHCCSSVDAIFPMVDNHAKWSPAWFPPHSLTSLHHTMSSDNGYAFVLGSFCPPSIMSKLSYFRLIPSGILTSCMVQNEVLQILQPSRILISGDYNWSSRAKKVEEMQNCQPCILFERLSVDDVILLGIIRSHVLSPNMGTKTSFWHSPALWIQWDYV